MSAISEYIRMFLHKAINLFIGKNRALHWVGDNVDKKIMYLQSNGYLYETGWVNSIKQNQAIDKDNNPLPWLTFPFIYFIESRLKNQFSILEFGSGSSTIYFASLVGNIISFENNSDWYALISKKIPKHVKICPYRSASDIQNVLENENKKYDIVLIDNSDNRLQLAQLCLNYINESEVIILDDSEIKTNYKTIELLLSKSYKKIDFYGLASMITYQKCTSLFYKDHNCLNI